jgi:ABC-type transport system involved in cytochrome c biogenesis ATPase subunit
MLLQKRIHDWSKTLPPWQSDLLRRLAAGPLTDDDRAEVRAILLGEVGGPAPIRVEPSDLPVDEDEHGRVELRSLGNFRNINCLAEDQTVPLRPGLNVVFGKNGSGKTGHGRLLRGVCRAAGREAVLPNVFKPSKASQPQTAEIKIAVDGAEKMVDVDLAKQPERILSAISVFDASCARIFLTKPNVVDYVPRALMILKSLAEEQDTIAEALRSDAANLLGALPALPLLPEGTAAAVALGNLGASSDLSALEQLAELSEAEAAELEQLEMAAATIRADKSGELERAARTRAAGGTAAASAIRDASARVDDDTLTKITETRRRRDVVLEAERELVAKAFASSRFPGAGGEPWLEMWSAIVRYVEVGGGTFPSAEPGALCPTCEQELTPEAALRLADAEEFVRSDLRQQAEALDNGLRTLIEALPDTDALTTTVTSELRGAPEEVVAAAHMAVSSVATLAGRARMLAAGEPTEALSATIDLAVVDEYVAAQTQAAEVQAALRDTERQHDVLRKLAELQARRTLTEHLPVLKKRIKTLERCASLEGPAGKLGTQGISMQLRKLQEAEITERLRSAIQEELEHTSSVTAKVELVGQASKGETKIQLRLAKGCRHKVDSVLSTGEQAALGTAFFLAELSVSAGESTIVLEDPVSSLDHDHREYLARRLVDEAQKRQVVVYTHDLTFLVYLQDAAVQADVELHGNTLESSLDETGIVREGLPTNLMSPADRRKELRRQLRFELRPMFKGRKANYERAADLWVADLRKGYDQLIEDYVLAGTVRRFSQHVRVRHLFMITWTPEIASRIEKAMKQASPKSHYEATELYPRAYTPDELEAMLVEFEEICDLTAPKNVKDAAGKGDLTSEQTTLEDELVAKVASFPPTS